MKYDFITIIKLISATLLPVILSVVFYVLERKTPFGKLKNGIKQTIIGVVFASVAILGTEFGIPVEGAILNVRNSAPLVAGLVFGAPSGIIAGVIGGIYRFVATYWGAGEFSQVACSVGCILAGLFGAGCRKFMFDDKKPSWIHGLVIGATSEVLHMLLVFVCRMGDVYGAYKVVSVCALPMIICTALSVMLSLLFVSLIGKERVKRTPEQKAQQKALAKKIFKTKKISSVFQLVLLISVIVGFGSTMAFTTVLQTRIAYANADGLLSLNLNDVKNDLGETETEDDIRLVVANRHIGKEGGIIVCKSDGIILYDNGGHTGESIYAFESTSKINATEGVRFVADIGETKSFCMFTVSNGLYIIAYLPESEAMFSRNIAVTILAFMEVIVFSALFVHVYFLLKKHIVDNIHKINGSLAQITDGNLNVLVDVRENQEFASLSDDINATVDTLKRYIAEAESRIDRELEFARQIQQSALPSVFPPFPERTDFEIYALMNAAKEVGGDFYDFWLVDKTRVAFLVADVSGKGIPGALFMMRAKTLIKNLAESGLSVDEVFTRANKELCENNDAEMFVTAWMGVLDTESGVLQYVNAGHNPPLVGRKGEPFEYLRTKPNFVLAGFETTKYKKYELVLSKGDRIFLYTDGVTEATDIENKLYGEERLKNVVSSLNCNTEELCNKLRADITEFVKGAEQSDDITMLCVKLNDEIKTDITVVPNKENIVKVVNFVSDTIEKWDVPMKLSTKVQIAVDEIFSNIAYYSGASTATITLAYSDEKITIDFSDDGKPYDPTTAKEPDITLSAEERDIGGLGIFMVKKMCAEIEYKNENGRNLLTIVFRK